MFGNRLHELCKLGNPLDNDVDDDIEGTMYSSLNVDVVMIDLDAIRLEAVDAERRPGNSHLVPSTFPRLAENEADVYKGQYRYIHRCWIFMTRDCTFQTGMPAAFCGM